ncbi:LysR family transcriptional regulator [Sphingomonas sp. SORGH_AS_0879]|uniref:LysR family transcriptional regulator n=1 Tax=Sphingomonas sp. SORGH_AS_0879 TaxID=3041790 RepID=UPI0027879ABC|nr:LysR family transcriptional regulator [Sphingomonas sp. SORGH_AS_0879]MDQ1231632.1 DNA-binding transcriptional LysR family regulator [Sphingomonas sp. SORGH_AS_0879]
MIPLNCELLDLRALVAIADGKSFLRAAEQLNLSQPALSRRIQKLETTVGTPLLERTTRSVRLTPAGQEIVPLIRRLLDEMDGSLLGMMALGERQAGRLTVASIPSATVRFLPDVLERFAQEYRNVRVRVLDLSATECAEAVRTGEAEFGITLPLTSDGDLVFEPLTDDPYGLVCRQDDPLATLADPSWADLSGRRLVTVHMGSGNRTTLEAGLARAGVELRWFYEVTRLTSALALVQAGLGPSVLPRLACQGPDARDLVWRPLKGAEVMRTIGVLRRSSAPLSPTASRLMALLAAAWIGA